LAGLSAACYLNGRGYDVTLVEREELPGGRAGVLHSDGFTFDTGPTVLTMPDLIADALRAASRDPAANLHELMPMRRLDPAYRACFADGSTINVRSGREAMREEIAHACGNLDAAAFDSFVDWLRRLYLVEMPNFIDRNYDSALDCCLRLALSPSWCGSAPLAASARRCANGSQTLACIGCSPFRPCTPVSPPILHLRFMQ
jgi:phytoene desaturase